MRGTMCAMTSRPYGWGLRNIAKSDQETANCETFSFFSKTVITIRPKFSTPILHYMGAYVCNEINIVKLQFEKHPKLTKEQPIVNFFNVFKDSRHDSNEIFYSHSKLY